MTKRYGAQIVFMQSSTNEHKWIGRLLNPDNAIDTQYDDQPDDIRKNNSGAHCIIKEDAESGRCSLMVQGADVGGRRYSVHDNLSAAQTAAIKWAARRFKVEA